MKESRLDMLDKIISQYEELVSLGKSTVGLSLAAGINPSDLAATIEKR
jgi:hypothetical protein